ncbi:MAG: hypothetical protein Q9209_002200 [Squamulea sp. 1 TL-2023]
MASPLDRDTRLSFQEKTKIKEEARVIITQRLTVIDVNFASKVVAKGQFRMRNMADELNICRYIITDEIIVEWTEEREDYLRLKKLEEKGFVVYKYEEKPESRKRKRNAKD